MGNTLSGFTVLYGATGSVAQRDVNAWPVAILGKAPDGTPQPIGIDASGFIIVSGGGGGSGGTLIVTPRAYTGAGASSASSNNTSVQIGPDVTVPRKIDISNPNSGAIWVERGGAAAVGGTYYLTQYGVLSVDEPTTDQFFFISPSGAQTCRYCPRIAAT